MCANLGQVHGTALDEAYDAYDALQKLHARHIEREKGRYEARGGRGEGEARHDVRRDRARCEHVMSKLIRVSSVITIL